MTKRCSSDATVMAAAVSLEAVANYPLAIIAASKAAALSVRDRGHRRHAAAAGASWPAVVTFEAVAAVAAGAAVNKNLTIAAETAAAE